MKFDKEKFMRQVRVNGRLAKRKIKEGFDEVMKSVNKFWEKSMNDMQENFEEFKEDLEKKECNCEHCNCHKEEDNKEE